MDELEAAALRALQSHELKALRHGHELGMHLTSMSTVAWEKSADHSAAAWVDLEAQHAMEGEALRQQWQKRKTDLELLKQVEMSALVAKHLYAEKALQDGEAIDEEAMMRRHVFEHDCLRRSLARDQDMRTKQAQMVCEVLACEQNYANSSLGVTHDLQNEASRHKHVAAAAKFDPSIEPLPINRPFLEPLPIHEPLNAPLSIDELN